MKNIIKRGLMLLLLSLALQIPVSSQTTLDSIQSKTLCLILNEHEKLSIENPLLKQEITSLKTLNSLYEQSEKNYKEEIILYKEKMVSDEKEIKKLKSRQKKTIISSSVGGIVLFILGLIL